MCRQKESAPTVERKRATDLTINNSLARGVKYDMVRDDPERWEGACRLIPVPFAAFLAIYLVVQIADGGLW